DSRLSNRNNTYDLFRVRAYGDLTIGDRIRIFAEYLYADSAFGDLPPLRTDIDRSDLLNAFVELRTIDIGDDPLYVRIGRQELLYGSQRLISPLDWANTRRTFQGAKAYWHSENLDIDGFWVEPVIVNPTRADTPDHGQQFGGSWLTYRPAKGQAVDLYWLFLDNNHPQVARPL